MNSERAMVLWNNDKIVNLIKENRHIILLMVFPALEHNLQCHWNQVVLNLTYDVRKTFQKMDSSLFNTYHSHYEKEQDKLTTAIENKEKGEGSTLKNVSI
ncbi:hypothetical protein M9H77_33959 [Catharanthus roseus]|uniref:Uncharacterized protein n=1 Tax=Catharanthus roseus TaxID=4058 RepID=A0ACB9ZLJ3_CATRO|nr:hypothetical protein M9H77_33959 [Catharanthus roseus]